jgi:transposase-like protein
MKTCPKCKSEERKKDGIVREKQRYKCKECNYRYTVEKREAKESTQEIRKLALKLYLEGLGFRSIGRILGFSHVSVYYWIRDFGKKIIELGEKKEEHISVIEIDEMHTYIGNKKTTNGYGLLLIDLENGSSVLSLGREMQKQVKNCGIN